MAKLSPPSLLVVFALMALCCVPRINGSIKPPFSSLPHRSKQPHISTWSTIAQGTHPNTQGAQLDGRVHMHTVIAPAHTPDPFVIFHEPDKWYYSVRSKIEASRDNLDPPGWNCWAAAQDQIIISRARSLKDVFARPNATAVVVDRSSVLGGGWGGISVGAFAVTPPVEPRNCPSAGFWAPSMKHINGRWYIFATGHRPDIPGEVNFVLECASQDPLDIAAWHYRGMLNHALPGLDGEPIVLPTSHPAGVNVTMLDNGKTVTGQLYYLFSHNNFQLAGSQQLNLVRLHADRSTFIEYDVDREKNMTFTRVWTAAAEATISFPILDWESQRCSGCAFNVNEGPTALYGPTSTFIMFSASFCATKYYALGLLEFQGEGEGFPFVWAKLPRPVFSGDVFDGSTGALLGVKSDVFGVGHNSVTVSPDLSEQWLVYHGKIRQTEGPFDREARTQRFGWRLDGRPDFYNGPLPRDAVIPAPSNFITGIVLCQGVKFTGFCVGLQANTQYRRNQLSLRGVLSEKVRSVKLVGGASMRIYVQIGAGELEEYRVQADCESLPQAALELASIPQVVWEVTAAPSGKAMERLASDAGIVVSS